MNYNLCHCARHCWWYYLLVLSQSRNLLAGHTGRKSMRAECQTGLGLVYCVETEVGIQVEVEVGFAWHAWEGCNLSASRLLAHPRSHPSPLCDLSRHLTYVLSSIQFLNMRHVTHTLHVARCARHLPVSVLSGECTQLDAGPAHCALYMYSSSAFQFWLVVLWHAQRATFPIALLPSPMGFYSASSFLWFLFSGLPFVGWPAPRDSRLCLSCGCGVQIACVPHC